MIYAVDGKFRGGNSAFAFIGNYITLTLKGTESGEMIDFEGTALQLPGVTFKAVLTRISD